MPSLGALSGVRVLDLSRVMAGPFCTQILGDLGAEVVKIEPPWGDDTRRWGPPYFGDISAYFASANRNKQSIVLDLSQPEGAAAAKKLAERADVLVENFKVGGLAGFGLDYTSLQLPRLVYCSITGFGQTGPRSSEPGYDFMIQALSGLMSLTGEPDGRPLKVGIPAADLFTGLYAAVAILAALRERDQTGRGKHLDLALYDCTLAALSNQASSYFAGAAPTRLGNAHPSIVPYETVRCADGDLALAVGNDGQHQRLWQLLGAPERARDPRFSDNKSRVENRAALMQELAARLVTQPVAHWLERLQRLEIPASPVRTVAEAFDDPQAQARGLRAMAGQVPTVSSPLAAGPFSPPPALGQHTSEVLRGIADKI